jgi:hypothetical protein
VDVASAVIPKGYSGEADRLAREVGRTGRPAEGREDLKLPNGGDLVARRFQPLAKRSAQV